MKKTILLLTILLYSMIGFAQGIERLSQSEINANETSRAVAYNFVNYIIEQEYVKMNLLMTPQFRLEMREWAQSEGVELTKLFTREYMHDIVDMRPVVQMGYDLVIYNSWILDTDAFFDMYGETNPYKGLPAFSVSFTCVDANDNVYDGTYGEYDVTARVLLVRIDGEWKVFGFK